jgi:hypothetical protein
MAKTSKDLAAAAVNAKSILSVKHQLKLIITLHRTKLHV